MDENVKTRLFRKLGVRSRSGAFTVADSFSPLPATSPPPAGALGVTRPPRGIRRCPEMTTGLSFVGGEVLTLS
jgi:hypothetical protein